MVGSTPNACKPLQAVDQVQHCSVPTGVCPSWVPHHARDTSPPPHNIFMKSMALESRGSGSRGAGGTHTASCHDGGCVWSCAPRCAPLKRSRCNPIMALTEAFTSNS